MRLADYKCKDCNQVYVDMNLVNNHYCPKCGHELVRIYSVPAVEFKGSGFYSTDSKPKNKEK